MGQKESKETLSKHDLEFLKSSTRYDEDTIKEKLAISRILSQKPRFLGNLGNPDEWENSN